MRSKSLLRRSALAAVSIVAVTSTMLAADPAPSAHATGSTDRLFLSFAQDAAIVPSQWWEGQLEYDDGSKDIPVDALILQGVVAFQPFRNIEIGGRVGFGTTDTDPSLPEGSGATDLEAYAKYFFGNAVDRVDFTAGLVVTVPTGDDYAGLGFNAFAGHAFGAMRYRLENAVIGGTLGVRFTGDGDLLGTPLNGKTAFDLGVSVIIPVGKTLSIVGEAEIETEPFDGFDSPARLLAGVNWKVFGRGMIRAAVAGGLTDATPNFQIIAGYAYTF